MQPENSLEESCFEGCSSLTSIYIPETMTSFGKRCFWGCSSLTSIIIPTSVTSLGLSCFFNCSSLTSITIPSSVTKLGDGCFFGCSALTSITVDDNNPLYDSRENCNAIIKTESNTMVSGCMNTIIPSSVTSLEDGCFWGCSSLTSITIPTSVTSLGESSFAYCKVYLSSIDSFH